MSTKIIELKDMEGNILLPQAYSASHDNHGNDFSLVYATITTVNTKANDNAVVHLSGNETITGIKTLNTSDQISLILKGSSIDSTLTPSSTQYGNFIDSKDKNDTRISRVFSYRDTAGANGIGIQAWNSSTNYAITVDSLGITTAPTPSSATDNTAKIATTAWVNSHIDVNPNIVRTIGNQSIGGVKTFDGSTIAIRNPYVTKGTDPESTNYWALVAVDKDGLASTWQNTRMGILEWSLQSNGISSVTLNAYRNEVESSSAANIRIICDRVNNKSYATAPGSDMASSILTTAAISKASNGYVKLGNGMIIQWGRGSINEQATLDITLPTPFSDTNYAVIAGQGTASTAGDAEVAVGAQIQSATVIRIYSHYINPNTVTYYWIAIGY